MIVIIQHICHTHNFKNRQRILELTEACQSSTLFRIVEKTKVAFAVKIIGLFFSPPSSFPGKYIFPSDSVMTPRKTVLYLPVSAVTFRILEKIEKLMFSSKNPNTNFSC